MAHAYTTKRGKNKIAKLGNRKDHQQNSERSLKKIIVDDKYDGPKEKDFTSLGRIASKSSSEAKKEKIESNRIMAISQAAGGAVKEKCGNGECKHNSIGLKLSECTGCFAVKYCSRDCQVQDWSSHKVFCKAKQKQKQEENDSDESDDN